MFNIQLMSYHKEQPFTTSFKMDNVAMSGTLRPERKLSKSETIHSGHFMVSEIEDSEAENKEPKDDESHELLPSSDGMSQESNKQMSEYDLLEETEKKTTQTYVSGSKTSWVQIDGSLAKLFRCMNLAYSGKITSPRWKTFKGLKLHIKDKIRLNNIIWRAWHIQCTRIGPSVQWLSMFHIVVCLS